MVLVVSVEVFFGKVWTGHIQTTKSTISPQGLSKLLRVFFGETVARSHDVLCWSGNGLVRSREVLQSAGIRGQGGLAHVECTQLDHVRLSLHRLRTVGADHLRIELWCCNCL